MLKDKIVYLLFVSTILVSFSSKNKVIGQELITPESEYVLSMVRPAVEYLKTNYAKRRDYGNAALVGLAIYNAGLRQGLSKKQLVADPVMKEILERVSKDVAATTAGSERRVYAACVAGLLLAEVDEKKYRREINHVLDLVYERQLSFGGWGYTNDSKGDTSQTQYASLFLWLCQQKKVKVKPQAIEKAIRFLVTTQHPSGGFVYKSSPGQVYGTVTQSLTAAGLGSIYLLGDAFGLHGGSGKVSTRTKTDSVPLPPSVSLVDETAEKEDAKPKAIREIAGFDEAKRKGNDWFRRNFTVPPSTWTYYFLYGYERYSSFKERAENTHPESPAWYSTGAKFLKANQSADGSWQSENAIETTKDHSTAFAILFLVRSTQLIVPTYVDVTVTGQRGLPLAGPLTFDGNRLVNLKTSKEFNDLISLVENEENVDWAKINSQLDSLILSTNQQSQAAQMATLRQLIKHENPVIRRIAVKAIGKSRDFDNVPALILALSDPEPEISKIAHAGLRFISRKFEAVKLSKQPNEQELENVIEYWSEWYMDVVPDGQLIALE